MIVKKVNLKYSDVVLVISDLQIPFEHPQAFEFLQFVKDYFKPTKIVNVGDEVDQAFLSYHEKDPDGMSANQEMELGRKSLARLAKMFPKMDIAWSNHGALHLRKAKSAGIPKAYIKGPHEVWGVPKTWEWSDEIVLKYPHIPEIVVRHQLGSNSKNNILARGCSVITGHFHSTMELVCRTNHYGQLIFGAIIGCLIDRFNPTFGYAANQKDVQQLGVMVILNGNPVLVPMWVDKNNKWVGPKASRKLLK